MSSEETPFEFCGRDGLDGKNDNESFFIRQFAELAYPRLAVRISTPPVEPREK